MQWRRWIAPLVFAAMSALVQPCAADSGAAQIDRMEVFPRAISLIGIRSECRIVAVGYRGSEAIDLSRAAKITVANPPIAVIRDGLVIPKQNGTTAVAIAFGGRSVLLPLRVAGAAVHRPVSFAFDVVPVLTKQGCASGSCHGSPHGKGGFSLSLHGYDPSIDSVSLTRDASSRRVNLLEPADSLILKKPLLELPHGGGKRLRRRDAAYAILRDWIAEGTPTALSGVRCMSIAVAPGDGRVLRAGHMAQQLRVEARYSDGSVRDVTRIATFETSKPSVAMVDADGYVTGVSRGGAAISVRYLDRLVSVDVTVVQNVPGFRWTNPPEFNAVDRLVDARLKLLQFQPAPIASDSEFLRRIYLDLTGLLPSPERTRMFLADYSTDKRSRLIDSLVSSEECARFSALKFADLVRVSRSRLPDGGADRFADWIVDAFRANQPWDRFAQSLLTSNGDAKSAPGACYFVAIPTAEERTEMTAQIFMGSRLECSKCHNHPFEKWTMRDYYSIAAVFARTRTEKTMVETISTGEALNPSTGEVMKPWGSDPESVAAPDRRTAFVRWLIRPGNPYFSRVEVNRIWAALMGRGIVEPVDDFRSSNPPSNGPLLDALASEFERSGYDRRAVIRVICSSRVYQSSSRTSAFNRLDDTLFSHARTRLLTAEQLKDAMALSARAIPPIDEYASGEEHARTAARQAAPGTAGDAARAEAHRIGQRADYATQRVIPDRDEFAAAFGQPERTTACTCERQSSPTLIQALEMLNGPVQRSIAGGAAARYASLSDSGVVQAVYIAALCRYPTAAERDAAMKYIARHSDRQSAIEDFFWATINRREFLFQH